jgi:hypothetical protein
VHVAGHQVPFLDLRLLLQAALGADAARRQRSSLLQRPHTATH